MSQYETVAVKVCKKCKAVLKTHGGAIRHAKRCQYAEPQIDGQISFMEEAVKTMTDCFDKKTIDGAIANKTYRLNGGA